MKRTGEILKKAREQKGLSINEIGLSLKISNKILRSIEEGDVNQLPAKTFLRGFVQSYAAYLRLDVNEVLKIFQEEMGSTRPEPIIQMPEQDKTLENSEKIGITSTDAPPRTTSPSSSAASDRPLHSLRKNNNSKTLMLSFFGVILVGLIIFTKKMIDKYQKEGTVSETEVSSPLATPVESPTPAEAVPAAAASPLTQGSPAGPVAMSTPLVTPTPMVTATPAPAHTPAPTATPAAAHTPAHTPTPTPTATATPTPKPSPTPTATPAPSASPSPTPAVTSKPVEVIIEALDAVEVEVATKDGKVEKVSMTAEQVHTFKSKNGLKMSLSNGGAVNVIVNGKDLGIPGNLGKPVKLNF